MGFWRHSNGTRSLTHLLTHSILFKSNYTLYSYLPLNITFVQSAFYAYVWHILGGTSKACIFLDTKEKPAEDVYKWKYSKEHWQYHMQEMDCDLKLLKGHWNNWAWIIAVYLDELCTFVPRCCDLMWRSGDRQSVRELSNWRTMGFPSAKSE